MKVPMIWKGASRLINGRRVHEGQTVQMSRQNAKVAKVLGWATDAPVAVPESVVYTPPARARTQRVAQAPRDSEKAAILAEGEQVISEDIEKLRAQYEAKTGEAPDRRWGLTRLRQALGGRTYQRRDMRATED